MYAILFERHSCSLLWPVFIPRVVSADWSSVLGRWMVQPARRLRLAIVVYTVGLLICVATQSRKVNVQ